MCSPWLWWSGPQFPHGHADRFACLPLHRRRLCEESGNAPGERHRGTRATVLWSPAVACLVRACRRGRAAQAGDAGPAMPSLRCSFRRRAEARRHGETPRGAFPGEGLSSRCHDVTGHGLERESNPRHSVSGPMLYPTELSNQLTCGTRTRNRGRGACAAGTFEARSSLREDSCSTLRRPVVVLRAKKRRTTGPRRGLRSPEGSCRAGSWHPLLYRLSQRHREAPPCGFGHTRAAAPCAPDGIDAVPQEPVGWMLRMAASREAPMRLRRCSRENICLHGERAKENAPGFASEGVRGASEIG